MTSRTISSSVEIEWPYCWTYLNQGLEKLVVRWLFKRPFFQSPTARWLLGRSNNWGWLFKFSALSACYSQNERKQVQTEFYEENIHK